MKFALFTLALVLTACDADKESIRALQSFWLLGRPTARRRVLRVRAERVHDEVSRREVRAGLRVLRWLHQSLHGAVLGALHGRFHVRLLQETQAKGPRSHDQDAVRTGS